MSPRLFSYGPIQSTVWSVGLGLGEEEFQEADIWEGFFQAFVCWKQGEKTWLFFPRLKKELSSLRMRNDAATTEFARVVEVQDVVS